MLFYNIRILKLDLRSSLKLVIKETTIFWEKANISIQKEQRCIAKLELLYNEWRDLQKSRLRTCGLIKKKTKTFVDLLDNLFDIAHTNAFNLISSPKAKDFLTAQRQNGRPGHIFQFNKNVREDGTSSSSKQYLNLNCTNTQYDDMTGIFLHIFLLT